MKRPQVPPSKEIEMKVVEIFKSIDGEGKRTGKVATFIRLAGCNLRCVYCDTTYSFDTSTAQEMSIEEIVGKCFELGTRYITLTGGEPLIHPDAWDLVSALCTKGFQVNIETNGSVDLRKYIEDRDYYLWDVFFTVDYKTKYSGMSHRMKKEAFEDLDPLNDLVKCVVASKEDMDGALQYLDSLHKPFNIWFSPVFGAIDPKEIVEYVLASGRTDITVQIQLHKIIWDPNERGV